jgi:hypothetical protein
MALATVGVLNGIEKVLMLTGTACKLPGIDWIRCHCPEKMNIDFMNFSKKKKNLHS